MLKKNKWKVILSSMIVLLPMLYGLIMWNKLPDVMTTHWGADSHVDGVAGKAFAVFGMPALLLITHFVCIVCTLLDKKQKEQNQKALGIVFWIMPMISLLSNGIVYRAAFGKEIDLVLLLMIAQGIMFIMVGNYLPKIKQNRTLGIKVYWALHNEENWNKTHRFAGKVWVTGGFILLCLIFFPFASMMWVMIGMLLVIVILPVIYSYMIYRQHQKEGIVYEAPQKSKAGKNTVGITAIVTVAVVALMFVGDISVQCGETSLKIDADFWTDLNISYSEIESVEYRDEFQTGARTSGFGSVKLAMGIFQNAEFGSYTLYSYAGAEGYVILKSGEKVLVIGMEDTEEMQQLYDTLLEKIEK